eukprot:scaffold104812_cov48-Phaeocystis_antarctica.AAC.2
MTSPLVASSATSAPGASGCPLLAISERDERLARPSLPDRPRVRVGVRGRARVRVRSRASARLARPSLPDSRLPDWLPRGETHLNRLRVRVRVRVRPSELKPEPKSKSKPKP